MSGSTARKAQLHQLVDQLPEEEHDSALRYLQFLRDMNDPVLRATRNAPLDDEPVTDEDRAAIAASDRDLEQGEVISHADLKRQLGI